MPGIASALSQASRRLAATAARFAHLIAKTIVALQVRGERRRLMGLDDAALKDMGFNKGQAQGEYGRSFWDVPADRMRC